MEDYEAQVEALGGGYQVYPKTSSPHLDCVIAAPLDGAGALRAACGCCGAQGENWVCLGCHAVLCSRYVSGHAAAHAAETGHQIACSLRDLSFWDFGQDAYLDVYAIDALRAPYAALHVAKFGEAPALPARDARATRPALTLELELAPPAAGAAEGADPG